MHQNCFAVCVCVLVCLFFCGLVVLHYHLCNEISVYPKDRGLVVQLQIPFSSDTVKYNVT